MAMTLKFLLIWWISSQAKANGAEADACQTSFLQAELKMTPSTPLTIDAIDIERSQKKGFLNLLGRSFFSEDPKTSAEFWIKYSTAVEQKDDEKHHGTTVGWHESLENDAVVVKRFDGMPAERLYFLKIPESWLRIRCSQM